MRSAGKCDLSLYRQADGPIPTAKLRLDMQKAMQTDAAVFRYKICIQSKSPRRLMISRTEKTLAEGVEKVTQIYKDFDKVGIKDRSMIWNS